MSRSAILFLAFILATLFDLAYWAYEGRPQLVPDAGVSRIESASFSPYRRGQDPLAQITPSLDEISADVELLSGRVGGLRTYTSLEGLEAVPRFARPLGLKVTQGAWLGREPAVNEREIERAIELANRYPDVVTRVIVGNEVLLRRDLTLDQLAHEIDRVRAAIKQPVTYADVWEFWLKNPQLASHVDFITIHILPYWEDEPVSIAHALEHVIAIVKKVEATFPGKRIVVGEVGWPSAGRMRDGATPSLSNEARLVRGFLRFADQRHLDYNIFAAFDEPWKRALEGTVGGHWGLYDADRRPKFALSGPVSDDPNWQWHFSLSSLFAVFASLAAFRRWPDLRVPGMMFYAFAAQLLGTFLVLDVDFILTVCWTPFGWISGGLGIAASLILSALSLRSIGENFSGTPWPAASLPTAEEALNLLRGRPTSGPLLGERVLGLLQFGFVVGATVVTIALILDPRYRDFPSEAFLVPAFSFALLAWLTTRERPHGAGLNEEMLLTLLLFAGSAGIVLRESLANTQALGWSVILLLLALPLSVRLLARRRALRAMASG